MPTTKPILDLLITSIVGGLIAWLLAGYLPPKPTKRLAIAGVAAVAVLVIGYVVITNEPNGTVSRKQVQEWTLGQTDTETVQDVIYNQIHIIPGKSLFTVGDTIPNGVLITTDLGNNWQNFPVKEIVRNGGWGVFETVASFKSPSTGEYWLIVQ